MTGSVTGQMGDTQYRYDTNTEYGVRGNLTEIEYWNNNPDTPGNPIVEMHYDSYGNMDWKEDALDNRTSFDYEDLTETFPETITNALGHTVTFTYDYGLGKKKTETDSNGNPMTYWYDEFGRLYQTDFPDGGQSIVDYSKLDDVSEFPRYIKASVKEDDLGNFIEKWEYYDGLGRKIQTLTLSEHNDYTGETNQYVVSLIHYDDMGREWRVEGPFFTTELDYYHNANPANHPVEGIPWSETTFDLRGRPKQIDSPTEEWGVVWSSFEYNSLSTTITDPDGCKKTEVKDYLGRLIKVIEYADHGEQETKYRYNAAGNLLEVEDPLGNITKIEYDSLGRKRRMHDPDMCMHNVPDTDPRYWWTYTYYPDGKLWTQTDAKGQTITFQYDALRRIKSKTYGTGDPEDRDVSYEYDRDDIVPNGKGRLYSVSNSAVTTIYEEYDVMGNVKKVSKTIDGLSQPQVSEYEYDLTGKQTRITYPDGEMVDYYYYPGTGLLQLVADVNNFHPNATFSNYKPTGKMGTVEKGDKNNDNDRGTLTTYSYDPQSTRLTSIQSEDYNQVTIDHREYGYSPAGDIEQINDIVKDIEYYYAYDKLHRLIGETNNDASQAQNSNVLVNTAYRSDHVHAVGTVEFDGSCFSYDYDENGNMIDSYDFTDANSWQDVATREIFYNADNMPKKIIHSLNETTTEAYYTYDAGSSRAKKQVGGNTTYYISGDYEFKDGSEDVKTRYIHAGNLKIAMVKSDATGDKTYYFHNDHLGSSTVITDENGNPYEKTNYLPFGGTRSHWTETGEPVSNYKYTGQELDPESGLYNYNARLYDPMVGMFITPDYLVPDFTNPQCLNRYVYCFNNPLMYVDPSGQIVNIVAPILFGGFLGGWLSGVQGGDFGIGFITGAVSSVVGLGAGSLVTIPGAGATSGQIASAHIVRAMVGGFSGGAAGGAVSAAFHGGNVWKSALTGSLIGAGTAGVIQVGIELNHFGYFDNFFSGRGFRSYNSYMKTLSPEQQIAFAHEKFGTPLGKYDPSNTEFIKDKDLRAFVNDTGEVIYGAKAFEDPSFIQGMGAHEGVHVGQLNGPGYRVGPRAFRALDEIEAYRYTLRNSYKYHLTDKFIKNNIKWYDVYAKEAGVPVWGQ